MSARRAGYAAVATAVTVAVVTVGVALAPVSSQPEPSAGSATQSPLARLRLADLDASRGPFCDDIPADALARAVGGAATASEYSSGERADLEPGLRDIAHEYGCAFTRGRTVARAWVFAAPVSRPDARSMVEDANREQGCVRTGVLELGRPGTVLLCTTRTERSLRAMGRVGDTWVHCELVTPADRADPGLTLRGQEWCAAVAHAVAS